MSVERLSHASRLRRAVTAWLLGAVLVLQLAAPVGGMPRPASDASARLAALATVVGHAVATCHDDGGQMPAGDAGPCCPCTLCHALTVACPAAPVEFALARPFVSRGGIAVYPQPPPRAPAVLLGLPSPRGPPLLV